MDFEAVIGLEVHAQLATRTKLFCSCPTAFGAGPNMQTCPGCLGHPGTLPVLNEAAIAKAVTAGLAIEGEISLFSRFDRKQYFYPDLPNAYQLSQYFFPIVNGGVIRVVNAAGEEKAFRVTRIHLEEDAGKLVHPAEKGAACSFVDLNRGGTPLVEIVSEPDMRCPEDAMLYLAELKAILEYAGVSDCNMEEGSLRCDANVSIRPRGEERLGTRVEIKNMNSIKSVGRAIEYEIKRQREAISCGEKLVQETRLFDGTREITLPMRSKEQADDYRYFPDPNLMPVMLDETFIEERRRLLPELPRARKARFVADYGITSADAAVLCAERALGDYFEAAVTACPQGAKRVANWIIAEVMRVLNERGLAIGAFGVPPARIGELVGLIEDETISGKIAKQVFEKMLESGRAPGEIVKAEGLVQVSDTGAIEAVIDQVLAANPAQVEQYRSGKTTVKGFLVGMIMKASQGKANPQLVNRLLEKKLGGN